ncbi:hypothetical protein QTO34_000773 [Cnephaeus nilssonii]|uniref:Uncharacterized protein n=1 Tax=Cnephaeus nilssonii TaxID=3371016 RepID=A0AA40IC69_CNENI|nr:hypothetical protein QTO34_000773 [Eptesicus nilssonii]
MVQLLLGPIGASSAFTATCNVPCRPLMVSVCHSKWSHSRYCYILFSLANHPMTMDRVEKKVKKRKYSEDFLQYGFTSIITAGIEKRQCVICCEVLSAESMKPNKLKCHFDSKHPSFASKDTNYFRSKADGLKKARLDTGGKYHKQNVAAVEASYLWHSESPEL